MSGFLLDHLRPADFDAARAGVAGGGVDGAEPKQDEQLGTGNQSAGEFAPLLHLACEAMVVIGPDWKLIHANQRAAELLQAGVGTGRPVWDLFPDPAPEDLVRALHSAMEERTSAELELFLPAPVGRWVLLTLCPVEQGLLLSLRDISGLRQHYDTLQRDGELLDIIQQTALAATWELDLATGQLSFGPGSFPLFGRPLEELKTLEDFERILYPPDRERVRASIAETIQSKAPVMAEFRVIAPDGRRIWIESRGTAVAENDSAARLRGISIDITERKGSEAALVASEGRYRVLADLNPQAIWMGAPDGTILYQNQRLLDYTGQTIESLGGTGWLQPFFPEDRDLVLDRWAQSVLTGEDYDVEARIVRASDGAVRWWTIRARAVRDEMGAVLHWLGVSTDVHDSRAAAETLHEKHLESERQRAELETIYQTAPVGLALFDPVELRCLRLNERQAEILGLPIERVEGRTLAEIAPMPGLEKMFRDAAAGRATRNQVIEGELPTRPNDHRVWNVSVMPVHGKNGAVQAITAAWLEITHLKRAESALVQSEKLAAVGRLASSISHEINNPLEAITNLLYLIAHHSELPADLKGFVHMAQSELARVSQIATQTLRFHRQAVRPTWVTPAELIDAVVNLYQGRLANSGIRVRATYSTSTRVLCFENDIRQVLNNLIANAIDAMRGGGQLFARAHDAVDYRTGRRGVRLTIADTGQGMSPSVQRRVFEPFFTTKDLNGTGLGLWISEGIVQRHQGRLMMRSRQGQRHGTVFSLFLPCSETPYVREMAA